MTQRTETLATAFEQVAGRLLMVADGLSDTAWDVAPASEARTAGQIAYHMAEVYQNVSGFIQLAVAGQPLPDLTLEILHGVNAEQAARYAGVGRAGALELLRQNGVATTALLSTLSDALIAIWASKNAYNHPRPGQASTSTAIVTSIVRAVWHAIRYAGA